MKGRKMKLALISNESTRKTTFQKRKKGLMKKASELATLCGINMCMIIYSSYNTQPEVWPSPSGVQSVLNDFNAMSKIDQSKKMLNQEMIMPMEDNDNENIENNNNNNDNSAT
ncbi:agamous-like MADS-box protein AGL80 [Carica papaya]|uniref:agamous-like MADS-box protein AGL80 n=1 Tax=Carica papaya TaxID=3649 RepID=UPI000B8CD932|nr:agamous-like MADS-box protein AGL80 [Carica papaya]